MQNYDTYYENNELINQEYITCTLSRLYVMESYSQILNTGINVSYVTAW